MPRENAVQQERGGEASMRIPKEWLRAKGKKAKRKIAVNHALWLGTGRKMPECAIWRVAGVKRLADVAELEDLLRRVIGFEKAQKPGERPPMPAMWGVTKFGSYRAWKWVILEEARSKLRVCREDFLPLAGGCLPG
jgi:hypothetical protein